MTPARIAHLIESDGPGGAERVVVDLATHLQAGGARNVVFVPADGEGWIEEQLAGSGVAVEHFQLNRPVSPACARALAAAFRRHQVTVAHSHEFSMAVYGAWASWLAGVPHAITMHGSRYYAGRLQRRMAMRVAIALSGSTVAVSSRLADAIRRDLLVPRSRIVTIANGVRPAAAEPANIREELGLRADSRLAVAIGNLYVVKGHRHLIDAISTLINRHPNLHVVIAGRGERADALMAHARALGVADHLHLIGLRSDVAGILNAADVFVLPSLSEGLPLALLEAMFAGRPIVASNVGEVGSALANGDAGVLVSPGDPRAIAAALDRLLIDPVRARALGERARRRAVAEYDVTRMVDRYVAMYDRLPTRARLPLTTARTNAAHPAL